MTDDFDAAEVIGALQKGLAEATRNEELSTHVRLALAYAELGMRAEAIEELEAVLATEPEHPMALAALSSLRSER